MICLIVGHGLLMSSPRNAKVCIAVVAMSQTRLAEDLPSLFRVCGMHIVCCIRRHVIGVSFAFFSLVDSRCMVSLLDVKLSFTPMRDVARAILSNDAPVIIPFICSMARHQQAIHAGLGRSPVIVIMPLYQLIPRSIVRSDKFI
jgi:hypothetical protein